MKHFLWVGIILILLGASYVHADVSTTTGIIPGQIWYSKEPLVSGDTVFIHTAVWNSGTNTLQAKVEFYNKNIILGSRDIVVLPGTLKDVSVSWNVTSGDHTISAKIISSSVTDGGKKEDIVLEWRTTSPDQTFVPIVLKTPDGKKLTTETVKGEVQKVLTTIEDLVPNSVETQIHSFDTIRSTVATQIKNSLSETKDQIKTLTAIPSTTKKAVIASNSTKPLDATEKPIAYIKLFLLTIVSFIFGYKILFYGIIAFLLLMLVRFFYNKIRNI